ncbi:hypothetical protein ABZ723_32550 [Streptomyces sp. NPDC006700]|uniref:hypothetical protein n=1 Tax=Streptomyces sp. NPDC006700 TaxID=3154479 RepID=UPI0033E2F141
MTTTLPSVLPRLARYVRSADPGACFFFSRADEPAGPSIALWIDSVPGVRRAALDLLRSETEAPWRLAVEQGAHHKARHPEGTGRDVKDELAAVSTAFALSVLPSGRPDPDEAFRLGVSHLRGIVRLLPEAARTGFLFQSWQSWSASLPPRRREELAVEADVRTATVPDTSSPSRQAYLDGTRQAVRRGPGSGLPEPYLLFHQAGATHNRLGIPPAWGAAAALTVRNELAERAVPVPAATSGGRV